MRESRLLIFLILLLILALFNQGCATILCGKSYTLVFKDECSPRAEIFLDGNYIGDAPGRIKIQKGKIQHGSILEIKAEGYETGNYLIIRKQSPVYSVVDILTGIVPLAIDFATGSIYLPNPRTFQYNLEKNQ